MGKIKLKLSVLLVGLVLFIGTLPAFGEDSISVLNKAIEHNLDYVMATYTTTFDPNQQGRTQNIKLGAQKIDGIIMKKGEVFSFNQEVGPRTKERGFKKGPVIVDGEFVDEVGGGVCQISSTVYNTVLLASLEIKQRQAHSRPVSYVDLGRGATVYYDYLDFKFKNTSSGPVLIMAQVNDDRLTVSLLGREAGPRVEITTSEPEVLDTEVEEKVDSSLPPGERRVVEEGIKGYKVVVKRIIHRAGEQLREEVVSENIYPPQKRIIKTAPH